MEMNLYVGPLTRYYTGNWGNEKQQGDSEGGLPAETVEEIVSHWRDSVLGAISDSIGQSNEWTESNEGPYWATELGETAFGALLLYAAAKVYGEPYPGEVSADWDFTGEPLIQRAMDDQTLSWSLFRRAQWWLPLEHPLMLQGETPTGDQITIATAGALLLELLRINELGWKADEDVVLSWQEKEGYSVQGTEKTGFSVVSLARYAYSILWQAVKFSLQNCAPILLEA